MWRRGAAMIISVKSLALLALSFVTGLGLVGCDHELETTCLTGDDCGDYQPEKAEQNLGECLETCNQTVASDETGEYPCAVQTIIDDICTNCHSDPPTPGVPFSLASYEDSQVLDGGKVVFAKIAVVIDSNLMPFGGPQLGDDDRKAILDDWSCVCGPPRPKDETCE